LRLEPGLRWSIYVTSAVLFATGIAWWILGDGHGAIRLYLIAVHGFAAMLFLVALGAILVVHVREGWRRALNRISGSLMLATAVLLALSACGLYYLGSDTLRNLASDLHIALGLFVPLILVAHVVLGRRARLRAAALANSR
jgi:hypothetical protein